jgi:hypothetical protein
MDLNLPINSDMDTIVRAMAEPDSGLDIRDRIWLKIPIPKSFLGKNKAVDPSFYPSNVCPFRFRFSQLVI